MTVGYNAPFLQLQGGDVEDVEYADLGVRPESKQKPVIAAISRCWSEVTPLKTALSGFLSVGGCGALAQGVRYIASKDNLPGSGLVVIGVISLGIGLRWCCIRIRAGCCNTQNR